MCQFRHAARLGKKARETMLVRHVRTTEQHLRTTIYLQLTCCRGQCCDGAGGAQTSLIEAQPRHVDVLGRDLTAPSSAVTVFFPVFPAKLI